MRFRNLSAKYRKPFLVAMTVALLLGLSYLAGQALANAPKRATPTKTMGAAIPQTAATFMRRDDKTHPSKRPEPVPIPPALEQARKPCQHARRVETCLRGRLMHAYAAIAWQKKARNHAHATTVRDITLDAINWAAKRYGVSAAAMRTVANCESHLWPFATNGQYKGVWQLGAMHRSDPIFQQVPWQDAYAQASHVARFVKAHGYSQWQCQPTGRLAW